MRFVLFSTLLFVSGLSFGQTILTPENFPDDAFRNWLILDLGEVTAEEADSVHFIQLYPPTDVKDLTGLELFTGLSYLYLGSQSLTSLPVLPDTLQTLEIDDMPHLTTLPDLSHTMLTDIDCRNSGLVNLPVFPATLQRLRCPNNQISVLPELPAGMTIIEMPYNQISDPSALLQLEDFGNSANDLLDLRWNHIGSEFCPVFAALESRSWSPGRFRYYNQNEGVLGDCLADNVVTEANFPDAAFRARLLDLYGPMSPAAVLRLTEMQLTSLAINDLTGLELFQSLSYLYLGDMPVSTVSFPNSLGTLEAYGLPNLKTLPDLSEVGLTHMYLDQTGLQSLPPLPTGLVNLVCSQAALTTLPDLPSTLELLIVNNNQLQALPVLPQGLRDMNFNWNDLTDPSPLLGIPGLGAFGDDLHLHMNRFDLDDCDVLALLADRSWGVGNFQFVFQKDNVNLVDCIPNNVIDAAHFPDPEFLNFLLNQVGPRTLEQLDVVEELFIVPPYGVQDLTGLDLFSALQYLQVYNTPLSVFPAVPANLFRLDIIDAPLLTELPSLAQSQLVDLFVERTGLTSLPELPSTLLYLNSYDNPIQTLPAMPLNLRGAAFELNQLTDLEPLLANPIFGTEVFHELYVSLNFLDESNCAQLAELAGRGPVYMEYGIQRRIDRLWDTLPQWGSTEGLLNWVQNVNDGLYANESLDCP